jgi:hypothetical protein
VLEKIYNLDFELAPIFMTKLEEVLKQVNEDKASFCSRDEFLSTGLNGYVITGGGLYSRFEKLKPYYRKTSDMDLVYYSREGVKDSKLALEISKKIILAVFEGLNLGYQIQKSSELEQMAKEAISSLRKFTFRNQDKNQNFEIDIFTNGKHTLAPCYNSGLEEREEEKIGLYNDNPYAFYIIKMGYILKRVKPNDIYDFTNLVNAFEINPKSDDFKKKAEKMLKIGSPEWVFSTKNKLATISTAVISKKIAPNSDKPIYAVIEALRGYYSFSESRFDNRPELLEEKFQKAYDEGLYTKLVTKDDVRDMFEEFKTHLRAVNSISRRINGLPNFQR